MLFLKRIKLTNFKAHQQNMFEFSAGLNAIIGRNGTGKSSIVDAIGIGLFNAYTNLSDFISYGQETTKIELEFVYRNTTYFIQREFGKSSLSLLLFNSDQIRGSKEVYSYLSELFGVDLKTYYNNILRIKSSSITYPFIVDSSKRKAIFDDIFGIAEYGQIWESLREPEKLLENKITELEKELFYEQGRLSSVNTFKQEIVELDKLTAQLDDKQKLYLVNKDRLDRLKQLDYDIDKFTRIRHQLESKSIELNSRVLSLDDKECFVCHQKITDELNKELKDKALLELHNNNQKIIDLDTQIIHLKTELDNLSIDNIKDYTGDLIRLSERKRILQQQLDNLQNDKLNELKSRIELYKTKLDELSFIRSGFKRLPQLLVDRYIINISYLGSDILSQLMDQTVVVNINQKYDLTFNSSLDFNQLSDGQQIMTALAIRFAIAKYFGDLGLVILDEPSINLDETSRSLLAEAIQKLGFSQILLISHDSIFENNIDKIIEL